MLKSSFLYEKEISRKIAEISYDLNYQWVNGSTGHDFTSSIKDNRNMHDFAVIDDKGEIYGLIGYEIDWTVKAVTSIYAVDFKRPSYFYAKHLIQVIKDIFLKYNLNKVVWYCYTDNPAYTGYKKLIKRFGGNEVGVLHDTRLLQDGKIHDSAIFEIMRANFLKSKPIKNLTYFNENDIIFIENFDKIKR